MHNRNYNTKALVESALLTAIVVVMMLVNAYVPIVGTIMSFILPLPITLIFLRHGKKNAIISMVASAILIGIFYNPFKAVGSLILYGLPGIAMGYGIKNKVSFGKLTLLLFAAYLIGNIVNTFIVVYIVLGKNIVVYTTEISKILTESINMSKSLYKGMGLYTPQMQQYFDMLEIITPQFLLYLLPGLIVVTSIIVSLIYIKVSKQILKKFKYEVVDGPTFDRVYIDNRIVAVLIIIYCLGVILVSKKITFGEMLLVSSQVVGMYLFLVIGMSALYYYLKNKTSLTKGMCILIIVMSVLLNFGRIYTIIGLVESIVDFRRLDKNRRLIKR